MRLYKKNGLWQQFQPALGLKSSPGNWPAPRPNYRRMELSPRPESEQAMADRAREIGVRQLAEAIARWGVSGTSTINTPTTDETAE